MSEAGRAKGGPLQRFAVLVGALIFPVLQLMGVSAFRLHISGAAVAPTGANDLVFAAFEDPTLPEPQLIVQYPTPSGGGP